MFNPFVKPPQNVGANVRRVLIVDPGLDSARALGAFLRGGDAPEVWGADTAAKALKLAAKVDPQLVFCELCAPKLDGAALVRALRRSDLACRKAAVIGVTANHDPQPILAARDAGAHEVLLRPIVARDFSRRIEAAMAPREWIESMDYVGPDRRRFNSADYHGPRKRQADAPSPPHAVYIGEALKIVRAALAALESDPNQARRALTTQMKILNAAAAATGDTRLALAVELMAGYLKEAGTAIAPDLARRCAADLLSYGGREQRAA